MTLFLKEKSNSTQNQVWFTAKILSLRHKLILMHALQIVWDPTKGIDLGFFTLHFYSMMWIVAFVLGFFITKRIYRNEGQSDESLDSLFIYSVLGIMIGARLGHVIFYQPELIVCPVSYVTV